MSYLLVTVNLKLGEKSCRYSTDSLGCVVMEVSVLRLLMNKLFSTDCTSADASANALS